MGADDLEIASPQHLVYQLSYDFYMGRYPVTNQEYSLYLRDTRQSIVMAKGAERYPISGVSWHQAQEYIRWLNNKYLNDLPIGYAFRLPSEAEWEKTARGVAGNIYPWGNHFDARRCNSLETGVGATAPVGSYSPQGDSSFGAADMAGNVWEWTRSIGEKNYASMFGYPYRFDDGREDESGQAGFKYVLRGGSFKSNQQEIRSANRICFESSIAESDFGFRVVICPLERE
jgi:formylglycine-generating enzyme required for sulfatase activity